MSELSKLMKRFINQELLALHTAYFAKVLSVDGNSAKIQPLNMIKSVGEEAKKQAVLTVPILQNVKKLKSRSITINGTAYKIAEITDIEAGDIVYCLCGERDITEAKRGNISLPPIGHHRISDSVIVGVI